MSVVALGPTSRSSDHGDQEGLTDDDHPVYAFLGGRAGGQSLIGGTASGEELELGGTSHVQRGLITALSQIQLDAAQALSTPVDENGASLLFNQPFTTTADMTLSLLKNTSAWTVNGGQPAQRSFLDLSTINVNVNPGAFQTFTWAHVFPTFNVSSSANHIPSTNLFAYAPLFQSSASGATTTAFINGLTYAPTLAASVAGGNQSANFMTALSCAPTWSVETGAAVDFGDVVVCNAQSPKRRLFPLGANGGTKEINSYTGLFVRDRDAALALGSGGWAGVRSSLVAGSFHWFLRNEEDAKSTFSESQLLFGTLDSEELDFKYSVVGDVFRIGETDSVKVGLHLDMQAISFGQTSPTDPADARDFFTLFPHDSIMSVGGRHGGIFVRGHAIDVNGQTVTDYNHFLMQQMPTFILNGGSIENVTGFKIEEMGTDGDLGNQALWMSDGVRSRLDGTTNHGAASPATITADQNNYAIPTGSDVRRVIRLATDASRTLTGLVIDQTGDSFQITNVGANDLVLAHENASSTATNRIISPTGADLTLGPNETALLWHDETTDRWRIFFHTGV